MFYMMKEFYMIFSLFLGEESSNGDSDSKAVILTHGMYWNIADNNLLILNPSALYRVWPF